MMVQTSPLSVNVHVLQVFIKLKEPQDQKP